MNQRSKTFLIEFQNLCHRFGVDFSYDLNGISFISTAETFVLDRSDIEVEVTSLEDLEAQVARLKD